MATFLNMYMLTVEHLALRCLILDFFPDPLSEKSGTTFINDELDKSIDSLLMSLDNNYSISMNSERS